MKDEDLPQPIKNETLPQPSPGTGILEDIGGLPYGPPSIIKMLNILGSVVGIIGMSILVYYSSWQIGLGVFLATFGNNLVMGIKFIKDAKEIFVQIEN